jgi:hypothetical protein
VVLLHFICRTGCDCFLEHEIVCINEWLSKFCITLIYVSLVDIFIGVVGDCFSISVKIDVVHDPSQSRVNSSVLLLQLRLIFFDDVLKAPRFYVSFSNLWVKSVYSVYAFSRIAISGACLHSSIGCCCESIRPHSFFLGCDRIHEMSLRSPISHFSIFISLVSSSATQNLYPPEISTPAVTLD